MWNLKNKYKQQNKNKLIDTENRLVVIKGEKGGEVGEMGEGGQLDSAGW